MKYTIYKILKKNLSSCKIKKLLAQFQHLYDELKDENEVVIADKYSYNAKRYTAMLTSKIIISVLL